jgi:hypothetical protein
MAAEVDPDNVPFSLAPGVLSERIARSAATAPVVIDSTDWQGITPNERGNRARDIAKALRSEIAAGRPIINKDRGREIDVSRAGLEHWSRYAADPRKAAMLGHLRSLFESAVFLRSEKPDARKIATGTSAFHKLAVPVTIDGRTAIVRLTVREDANGRWIYDGLLLEPETKAPADGLIDVPALESSQGGPQTDIQQAMQSLLRRALSVNDGLEMDDRFSLAPRSLASVADTVLAAQMRKPEFREKYLALARQRLDKLRQDWEWRVDKWGNASRRTGTDTQAERIRTPANIEAERKFRQRSRQRELIDEGMATLTPATLAAYEQGLTTLEDDPLVSQMLDRGKLMSKTEAAKAGKLKTDGKGNAGDYDGAPWLPPAWYGGKGKGYMPDQMAQELHEAGRRPRLETAMASSMAMTAPESRPPRWVFSSLMATQASAAGVANISH